jgi:hypothetical protein
MQTRSTAGRRAARAAVYMHADLDFIHEQVIAVPRSASPSGSFKRNMEEKFNCVVVRANWIYHRIR